MISTCFCLHCPVLIFHESILLIGCVYSFLRSYECQVAESELRPRSWRQFPPADIPIPLVFCCYCLVSKLCPSLCDPKDCSLPGSSVHGISQARILKWVAISFSRGIYPTQGLNLGSPALQANSLPLSQLGSLTIAILKLIGSITVCYNDVHGLTNAGIYYESYFKMFVLCYQ